MSNKTIPLLKGKTIFFTLLFLCFQLFCTAQNHYLFELNPKVNSPEVVDFTIVEVIDARLFTAHCGFVPNGLDGQFIPALFDGGMENAMADLLGQLFAFDNAAQEIALVVREFHINETNQSTDFGQLLLLYDFYLKRDSQYLPLLRVDDFQVTAGFNVKKSHSNNIVKSLQEAVRKLAASNWLEKAENSENIIESQADFTASKSDYFFQNETPIKPGIYRSYVEFRSNNPSITQVDIIQKKSGEKDILNRKEVAFKNLPEGISNKDLSKQMWGFSDGKNVYINNWPVFQEYSYSRLSSYGKYCPFIGKESLYKSGADRMAGSDRDKKAYAFDIDSGQSYLLDATYLEKILKSNNSLHHKYRQERDKENPNTKIWYAKELSEALSSN